MVENVGIYWHLNCQIRISKNGALLIMINEPFTNRIEMANFEGVA